MTQISGNPKCHCGPSVTVGANGGQVTNGILAQGCLTVSPLVSQPILQLFPQFQMRNWNRHTWQLTEPHISSLTCGEGYYGREGQLEAFVGITASTHKNSN